MRLNYGTENEARDAKDWWVTKRWIWGWWGGIFKGQGDVALLLLSFLVNSKFSRTKLGSVFIWSTRLTWEFWIGVFLLFSCACWIFFIGVRRKGKRIVQISSLQETSKESLEIPSPPYACPIFPCPRLLSCLLGRFIWMYWVTPNYDFYNINQIQLGPNRVPTWSKTVVRDKHFLE